MMSDFAVSLVIRDRLKLQPISESISLNGQEGSETSIDDLEAENARLKSQILELHEAVRQRDKFLGTLAHELRNPLAPISNALQILGLSKDANPAIASVRSIMQRQVNQLVGLVDELAEFSRMMRNSIELHRESVTCETILKRAIEIARPTIDSGRHHLSVSLPKTVTCLNADATRLTQVFVNLLTNAAKFSDPGCEISVVAERANGQLEVVVRDMGFGIAPEMLPWIFDLSRPAETHQRRSQNGLGVGLVLARHWVHLHGGQIEARSAGSNCGSEFTVRLPLSETAIPGESPTVGTPRVLARRILVVDDTRSASYILSKLLEALGQVVTTAESAEEALMHARRERPDMVITDITMPDVDGYELARRLRRERGLEDVTLVALTGLNEDQDRDRSKAAGFLYHLVKPVSLDALQSLLRSEISPIQ